MGDYPVRFPIPIILFSNLARLWNDFSNGESDIDKKIFLNWLNFHIYISAYNKMRTVIRNIGKSKPVIGGLGNVSYRVTKINKNYYKHHLEELNRQYEYKFINNDYSNNCRWLEILCRFGEYTNVGANRTAGMGVIRYHYKSYLSEKDLLSRQP